MRKTLLVALTVVALALPSAQALAAVTAKKTVPKKKTVTVMKSFTGVLGQADRWGEVEVTILVRKTTTTVLKTKRTTVSRKITAVKVPVFPNHTDRSVFINQQAIPMLVQETLQAQSTQIDLIGGATATSYGFAQSLQSAILKAKTA